VAPRLGSSRFPVWPMAQTAQTRVIPKRQWPGQLLAKKNVFYRAGSVFERRGEKRILALYLLRKQQKVEPRFGMADTVRSVALKEYYRQMERALREALTKD